MFQFFRQDLIMFGQPQVIDKLEVKPELRCGAQDLCQQKTVRSFSGCCDYAQHDGGARSMAGGAAWRRVFHWVIPRASRTIQQPWA